MQDKSLPDGWKWMVLNEACEKVQDGTHFSPKVQYQEPGEDRFLYITAKNIKENCVILNEVTYIDRATHIENRKRCDPQKGDVLLIKDGVTTGVATVNNLDEEFTLLSSVSQLRPKQNIIDAYYLKHYLNSPMGHRMIIGEMTGTAIKRIILNKIRNSPIPIPPLDEQLRIVAKIEELFTQLDAGTAALRRIQAELKRYKASVLKAACEGRLIEQDPSDEPAEELLRRLNKLPMIGNGLPSLPKGWCWTKIDDVADTIGGITKGRSFNGKKTVKLPYLRVANVQRFQLELNEMKEIDVLVSEVDKYRLLNGDIVLTEGGDWDKLGRSAIWKNQIPNCVHQNHIFRARVKSNEILPEWIMYYTNSERGQAYFKESAKQTTNLASINMTQLRGCNVPLPCLAEQVRIVSEIERRLSVVGDVEVTVQALLARSARLRQAILKRAFEGKLLTNRGFESKFSEELKSSHQTNTSTQLELFQRSYD